MIVMHMSGAYVPQDFYKERGQVVDCRHIQGTNCYCDNEAKVALRRQIRDLPAEDIHFLDSGNYHYLSLLWLEKLDEPFSLVLFDHHPDMQPPSFGEITSCGGWVKEVLDSNQHINRVYLVGVNEKHLSELEMDSRVTIGTEALEEDENPVYISFDKDVLQETDARCDWDQGTLALGEAETIIKSILEKHRVLGMDVCGEDNTWEQRTDRSQIIAINNAANMRLFELWENKK